MPELKNELTERFQLRTLTWLMSQLQNDEWYANLIKQDDKGIDKSSIVKSLVKRALKSNGVHIAKYQKSSNDIHKTGRLFCKGGGIQNVPKAIRGLLMRSTTTDVDMKNAHPCIFKYLCDKYNFKCDMLTEYIDCRDEMIKDKRIKNKQIVCAMLNFDKEQVTETMDEALLNKEILINQTKLLNHPDLKRFKVEGKNSLGKSMNAVLCWVENNILECACDFAEQKGFEISAYMFDGFMVYSRWTDDDCDELNDYIMKTLNIPITFVVKDQSDDLIIPEDYVMDSTESNYQLMKNQIEDEWGLAYIEDAVLYVIMIEGIMHFRTWEELMQSSLRTLTYEAITPKGIINKKVLDSWKDDPHRKTYTSMNIYPPDCVCPSNHLNLWTGFSCEKLNTNIVNIDDILQHIKILVSHDEPAYEFVLNWLSNMFQYPSSRSPVICLTSSEGAGKSGFVDLINSMIGDDKCQSINDIGTELFGAFNCHLQNATLLNINEPERKAGFAYAEKLKDVITNPHLMIHHKGKTPFKIKNLMRFFITTNNEDAMPLKEGQRRYMLAKCSDELIGNTEYFNTFYNRIKMQEVQYSFYKFLMNREVKQHLTAVDIPITETMLNAYALNKDIVEDYIEDLDDGEYSTLQLYKSFIEFCSKKGFKDSMNERRFSMKFADYAKKNKHFKKIEKEIYTDGKRVKYRGWMVTTECII